MKTVSVKVASFKEAFQSFMNKCDDSLDYESLVKSFSQIKEKDIIEHNNDDYYWCGNHHHSSSSVKLIRVTEPTLFYIVEYSYSEMSDNSHSYVTKEVFVP
jgi:hypothetical protein